MCNVESSIVPPSKSVLVQELYYGESNVVPFMPVLLEHL